MPPSPPETQSLTQPQSPSQALISEEVHHAGRDVILKATRDELHVLPLEKQWKRGGVLPLNSVFAAEPGVHKGRPFVNVSTVSTKKAKASEKIVQFRCKDEAQATRVVNALRSVLSGVRVGEPVPDRHILILVNPFGGTKKAPKIYSKIVKPMLDKARVKHTMMHTDYAGHAREIARDLDTRKYTALVTISGDGLFNEIVNGIMSRADARDTINTLPIGLIPGGTSNGLCKSIGSVSPMQATLNIIKGETRPFDLMKIEQPQEQPHYAFMSLNTGLIADIDIESEKFRWAGQTRMTITGVQRIFGLRKYHMRIWYREAAAFPAEAHEDVKFPGDDGATGWKLYEGPAVTVLAASAPWLSYENLLAPYSHISDGTADLLILDGTTKASNLLSWFLKPEAAKHVGCPPVKYIKVSAVRFEPLEDRGIMNIDGEVIPNKVTDMTVLPGMARIMVQSRIDISAWDVDGLPPEGHNTHGVRDATTADYPTQSYRTGPSSDATIVPISSASNDGVRDATNSTQSLSPSHAATNINTSSEDYGAPPPSNRATADADEDVNDDDSFDADTATALI